jgi:hypothetical protein
MLDPENENSPLVRIWVWAIIGTDPLRLSRLYLCIISSSYVNNYYKVASSRRSEGYGESGKYFSQQKDGASARTREDLLFRVEKGLRRYDC